MPKPKIHMIIKDLLRDGHICKEIETCDLSELVYDFMLFDRDKHLHFTDQIQALLRGKPGFSLIQLYPVNNTYWKFGNPIQEKFEFEVTLRWVE